MKEKYEGLKYKYKVSRIIISWPSSLWDKKDSYGGGKCQQYYVSPETVHLLPVGLYLYTTQLYTVPTKLKLYIPFKYILY